MRLDSKKKLPNPLAKNILNTIGNYRKRDFQNTKYCDHLSVPA